MRYTNHAVEVEELKTLDEVKTAEKDFTDDKQKNNHPNIIRMRQQDVKAERQNDVFERAWEMYDDDLVPTGEWL